MITIMVVVVLCPHLVDDIKKRKNLSRIVQFLLVRIFRNIVPMLVGIILDIIDPKVKKKIKY